MKSDNGCLTSNLKGRPSDTYIEDFLRFRSQPETLEDYKKAIGGVRFGKILENIDILAAASSFVHSSAPGSASGDKLQIVTASVDRIDLHSPLPTDSDLKMSSMVTFVGNSSLEVTTWLHKLYDHAPASGREVYGHDGSTAETKGELLLEAKFIMVAIDKELQKPVKLPTLFLDTTKAQQLFRKGAEHKAARQAESQMSLQKHPPTIEEMYAIHHTFIDSLRYKTSNQPFPPPGTCTMESTNQQTVLYTHPQERNIYGKIFGGYLMRVAYELGHITGLLFAKDSIEFISLDDISFKIPVTIGSILKLTSRVVFAKDDKLQVQVIATIIQHQSDEQKVSNEFSFTFKSTGPVKRIWPESYEESVLFIEGQRRFSRHHDE